MKIYIHSLATTEYPAKLYRISLATLNVKIYFHVSYALLIETLLVQIGTLNLFLYMLLGHLEFFSLSIKNSISFEWSSISVKTTSHHNTLFR